MAYSVFVRNAWKKNPSWPDGREPDGAAPKRYIARGVPTEAEARAKCNAYNVSHKAGKLGRRAEYEREMQSSRDA